MKTAVVTGGAKGLGRAIVEELANQGYRIAFSYLTSRAEAEELAAGLDRPLVRQLDVRDVAACEAFISDVKERFGRIDVLVNNVGDFIYTPLLQTTNEEFRRVIETNLHGAFYCTQAALKHMAFGGRIVTIGSAGCSSVVTRKRTAPYYAAKTALSILTKTFAAETAGRGITANMVSPGILQTSVAPKTDMPDGRPVAFDDVVRAILFLLDSPAVNGANLDVTKGYVPGYG